MVVIRRGNEICNTLLALVRVMGWGKVGDGGKGS